MAFWHYPPWLRSNVVNAVRRLHGDTRPKPAEIRSLLHELGLGERRKGPRVETVRDWLSKAGNNQPELDLVFEREPDAIPEPAPAESSLSDELRRRQRQLAMQRLVVGSIQAAAAIAAVVIVAFSVTGRRAS